jgi:hypothetical protein
MNSSTSKSFWNLRTLERKGIYFTVIIAMGLACLLAVGGSVAYAESGEEQITGDYELETDDYATEFDAPIESEVLESRFTFTNRRGSTAVFYGQLNWAYQAFDDGEETTDGIVDNGNWNSRLGFLVAAPLSETTLRFRFETGLGLRSSAAVSQDSEPDWVDWQRTALRWFESAWETNYGTVSAGQGSSASDGTAGMDESFTFHAGAADSTDGFSAFRFRDGEGELTDITVGSVNDSFDGARRFRLRYDTPRVAGLMLSSSYGRNVLVSGNNTNYYDVALRSVNELGDFSLRSAIGYGWEDNPDGENQERVAGSVTVVHNPTGLNLAVSAGSRISGADYYYSRAGWRADLIEVGTTSLSVDYYRGSDFVSDGARTENYGLYAVQSLDDFSCDIYAGWRRFTYSDQLDRSYQDADGILSGVRWFF